MANANEFKVTTQELIAVANGIRVLLGQPLSTDQNYNAATDGYTWNSDYIAKLNLISTILGNLSSTLGSFEEEGDHGIIYEIEEKIDEVLARINDINNSTDFTVSDALGTLEDIFGELKDIIHDAAIITGDEDPGQGESEEISRQNISELADEVLDLMDEEELDWEDLTDSAKIVLIIDDLLDIIEETTEALDEYRNGDFQIIETFSESTGTGIFTTIQNIETARRATMTPEQLADEAIVVYVTRCVFNLNESFICTGFINGVRKNGAFFYTDNQISNFYNVSAPTSNARLGAGKYLIRIVLKQEADFNAEV